jgi:hypothetical protein
MSLSLLVPLALGLGVLVGGPILAHMARQKPVERLPYGAMMLVQRLVKRLRRRRRLRDLLLLLLRALAVVALVLAVARPEVSWPGDVPEFGGTGRVVLIVDDSMSMSLRSFEGGPTLFSQAQADAAALIADLPDAARVGLIRLGGGAESVTAALSDDRSQLLADLASLEPGYGRTDLAGGLRLARGLLEDEPGEVVVFTDQAGPGVIQGATEELERLIERGSSVIPRIVEAGELGNLVVTAAAYGEGLEGGTITLTVENFGPDEREVPVSVTLPDASEITAFATVPAGGSAEVQVTVPPEVPGGIGTARVRDPGLALDDTRAFHLPRVGASRVLVVDGDPGSTPVRSEVYFLERALAPWGALRGGVLPETVAPAGLTRLDPDIHRVVYLANLSDPAAWSTDLVDFVRGGGGLVISLGSNVTADRYNAALRELMPSELRRARSLVSPSADGGVPLILPDIEDPLFAPFTRRGRRSLEQVEVRVAWTLEPYTESEDLHTLLRLADGNPVLIEQQVGQGRVLLWTSTLDLDWTNLPLQAAFLPLVQRITSWLGGEAGMASSRFEGLVGEPVSVPLPEGAGDPRLTGPNGEAVSYTVEAGSEPAVRFLPTLPGAYALAFEGSPPFARVAVNVDPLESDVRVGDALAAVEAELKPELFLRTAELGLWSIWLAVALLALQAVTSRVLGRRITPS